MITIRTFADPARAAVVVSFLKDNEIDAVLLDENSHVFNYAGFSIPIRLQVPDQQAEQASSLLTSFEAASASAPDSSSSRR